MIIVWLGYNYEQPVLIGHVENCDNGMKIAEQLQWETQTDAPSAEVEELNRVVPLVKFVAEEDPMKITTIFMNVNQNRNVVHFVVQDGLRTPGIIHVLLKKIANQFLS